MPADASYRTIAQVGPGHRIEIVAPDLPEGSRVEVLVMPQASQPRLEGQAFLDLIGSFPPGPRSAATWEEIEANLQADRDSWDR